MRNANFNYILDYLNLKSHLYLEVIRMEGLSKLFKKGGDFRTCKLEFHIDSALIGFILNPLETFLICNQYATSNAVLIRNLIFYDHKTYFSCAKDNAKVKNHLKLILFSQSGSNRD